MNIHAKSGTKVKFIEDTVSEASINYNGHTDPRGILKDGKIYKVDYTDVSPWNTDVFLIEFPNLDFNSVWFE